MRNNQPIWTELGRYFLVSWVLIVLSTGCVAAAESQFRILLLYNGESRSHQRVISSLRETLAAACPSPCTDPIEIVTQGVEPAMPTIDAVSADLLVAIGSQAANILARLDTQQPRLYGFIPHVVWRGLSVCCGNGQQHNSAIFIDQPLLRQFQLIRVALPEARHIGVLIGAASRGLQPELLRAAQQAGYELHVQQVDDSDQVGSKLRLLVQQADALLALPDPLVYNRNTIYSILLTSYGARLPLFAYSDSMVQAGAAAAIYLSPEDAGREIAREIEDYRSHGKLGLPHYGESFSVSVNNNVLKSLHLSPLSEKELLGRLKRLIR